VLALVLADQLVVGHPALVQRGLLFAHLGLGTLSLGLLLSDAGTLLGDIGAALALGGLFAVSGDDLLTALVELTLATAQPLALAQAR
jgi:hypothetical protein